MTRTSVLGTVKCINVNIYLISFRHFIERPVKIFTWSTVIGLPLRHYHILIETAKSDNSVLEIGLQCVLTQVVLM